MQSRVYSCAIVGLEGVEVEVDTAYALGVLLMQMLVPRIYGAVPKRKNV